jgi:hypothetical protein
MLAIVLGLYLLIGILLVTLGPGGANIAREVDSARGTPLTNAIRGRDAPSEKKLFLFRLTLACGFVLLWPFFIPSVMRENSEKSIRPSAKHPEIGGIRFQQMGGHGRISCKDCDFSESLTSFTHGVSSSSSGFQCQACGKFTSRNRQEPFKRSDESNHDLKLSELPCDERPSRIEHLRGMINLCEGQMKEMPRKNWLPTWESTVADCKDELRDVPEEEILTIKKSRDDFEKAYRATLLCECGGNLDREKTLFCPSCKSTKLSYSMEYIT